MRPRNTGRARQVVPRSNATYSVTHQAHKRPYPPRAGLALKTRSTVASVATHRTACTRPKTFCTDFIAAWSSQDSVDTCLAALCIGLKGLWASAPQVAVTSDSIVKRLDVIGHVGNSQFSVLVDPLLDSFLFQTSKERLRDGIVPAVPSSAHAGLEAVCST